MADIPTSEPARLVAGDTLKFTKTLPEFPADEGWVLGYTLVSAANRYTFSGTASGSDYLVNVSAATTATWVAGDYAYRAQVSQAGEVYTVAEGRLTVAPAFGAATDARSTARRALEAVEAYLADPNNLAAAQYQIAGRDLRRYTLPELWTHRDRLKAEVVREDAAAGLAAGLPDKRRILVRFGA